MVLAAARNYSSSRLMSRSAESEAPIAFSCSSRWPRSSAPSAPSRRLALVSMRFTRRVLLDADGAHFFHVGDAHQALLHAVLLERAHPVLQALRQHVRHARVLLDQFLQLVGGDQQLVQAAA